MEPVPDALSLNVTLDSVNCHTCMTATAAYVCCKVAHGWLACDAGLSAAWKGALLLPCVIHKLAHTHTAAAQKSTRRYCIWAHCYCQHATGPSTAGDYRSDASRSNAYIVVVLVGV
jgi:hypothetical protein